MNVVMKFGGSSVATIKKIQNVADIIIRKKKEASNIVVVVSAMGKTTNELISLSKQISKRPDTRELDQLMSTGEMVSASLLSMALIEKGHDAISMTGNKAGFRTKGIHTKSKIEDVKTKNLDQALSEGKVVVVAGFQGINERGDITTFGRGGSDTSAVALAAKLGFDCEIYTDVEGIYSVDPRRYKEAKKLDVLSFDEVMEMAHLGAKVIEPRSVELAKKYNVKVYIALNTADKKGTLITDGGNVLEKNVINNISVIEDVLLVSFNAHKKKLSDIFLKLAQRNINVDVISQSEETISFTSTNENEDIIAELFEEENISYNFRRDLSKVSVIGNAMRSQPGVAASVFKIFSENEIEFYQVSTSEISISYIIDEDKVDDVIRILAQEFNL